RHPVHRPSRLAVHLGLREPLALRPGALPAPGPGTVDLTPRATKREHDMQFLHETHIDFMKYRRFWIIVSFVLVAVGLYTIFGPHKLNLGIDFAGGTQITLAFRERPDI